MESKICVGCLVDKPLEFYHRQPKGKGGRTSRCALCVKLRRAELRSAKPDLYNMVGKHRKSRYGCDPVQYQFMLTVQEGRCAVCRKEFGDDSPHLDHDHKTGILRGLLCAGCNMAAGCLKDSGINALRLSRYLFGDHAEVVPQHKPTQAYDSAKAKRKERRKALRNQNPGKEIPSV